MLEWIAPSLQRGPTWEVDTFGDEEKATLVELFTQCDKGLLACDRRKRDGGAGDRVAGSSRLGRTRDAP